LCEILLGVLRKVKNLQYTPLTIWLFETRCHRSQKVVGSHVNLMLIDCRSLHLERGEIAENFIGSGIVSNAVLILNYLFKPCNKKLVSNY
jgi:hypothetical protein